jgi:hypothetical protein
VLAAYPIAVNQLRENSVEILWDAIHFGRLDLVGGNFPSLILPLWFVNRGKEPALIDWVALRLKGEIEADRWLWVPNSTIRPDRLTAKAGILSPADIVDGSFAFALPAGGVLTRHVALVQSPSRAGYRTDPPQCSAVSAELWMKSPDFPLPLLKRVRPVGITDQLQRAFRGEAQCMLMLRSFELPS